MFAAIGDAGGVVAGSSRWQLIFLGIALLIIALEIVRGWRLGFFRQLVRIGAVLCAYAAAIFLGPLFVPLLRPVFTLPDIVLGAIGGSILAVIVYALVAALGNFFVRRAGQPTNGVLRLFQGAGGGFLGIVFGFFIVWLLVVSIRLVGSFAETQVKALPTVPAEAVTSGGTPAPSTRSRADVSLALSLARLKNSVELGAVGEVVKTADVVPDRTYDTLAKAGGLLGQPERARRFLDTPGARDLSEHPRLVALREDPEIQELLLEGRLFELMQHPRIIEAANDPTVVERVRRFDLFKALEEADQPSVK